MIIRTGRPPCGGRELKYRSFLKKILTNQVDLRVEVVS